MTVSVNTVRTDVEVSWDPGDYEGEVRVFATGDEGDVHNTEFGPNDGKASLSYPEGFVGDSEIEVRDADGNVIDSGSISVG